MFAGLDIKISFVLGRFKDCQLLLKNILMRNVNII